jgi:hypothetical protein
MDLQVPRADGIGGFSVLRRCGNARGLDLFGVRLNETASLLAHVSFFPNQYASVPDMEAWLGGYDDGFCAWIESFPSTVPVDGWPVVITDEGASFPVNAGALEGTDCAVAGMAELPDYAEDGTLAFAAAPASVGVVGAARFDIPRNVYLHSGSGTEALTRGLVRPTALSWDPTGTRIGAAATIEGKRGLWLIDRSGERRLVFEGDLYGFAWAPDGRKAALIVGEPHDVVVVEAPPED